MARYQVILAYDGTLFQGSQRQARARTVQSVVEAALRQIGWSGKSVLFAGRTDSGVHASGQVVALDFDWAHTTETLRSALNANLPEDVAARDVSLVSPEFQPRYAALARRYRYRLFCQEVRDPLRERYAWRTWPPVELSHLQEAGQALTGTHDFAAFGSPMRPGGSTVRTVYKAEWQLAGDELHFEVLGNAFLYRMVRRMVYLQVQVGYGKLAMEALNQAFLNAVDLPSGLAPAQGLTLTEVLYPAQEGLDNRKILVEGSQTTFAASGEDDRGQNIRP